MKKISLFIIILVCISVVSFSQSKKAIILIGNDMGQNETTYDSIVRNYITQHLRKIPKLNISNEIKEISSEMRQNINDIGGDFVDSAFTNKAKTEGIEYLVLVYYYDSEPDEVPIISGNVKSTRYYTKISFIVQIVNSINNQILDSKHYGETKTMMPRSQKYYKTKQEAVKVSLDNSTSYFTDNTKNIDEYFKKTIVF